MYTEETTREKKYKISRQINSNLKKRKCARMVAKNATSSSKNDCSVTRSVAHLQYTCAATHFRALSELLHIIVSHHEMVLRESKLKQTNNERPFSLCFLSMVREVIAGTHASLRNWRSGLLDGIGLLYRL